MKDKILYIDMDGVLVDFQSGLDKIDKATLKKYKGREDEIPHVFSKMDPMPGAIESFNLLAEHFDTYILTTSPWENPTALQDKKDWVLNYLPKHGHKRLIISHDKNLNKGDYIIDDRTARGVDKFEGEHIHFGEDEFKEWQYIIEYLCSKERINL